jgi:hypothetical protein
MLLLTRLWESWIIQVRTGQTPVPQSQQLNMAISATRRVTVLPSQLSQKSVRCVEYRQSRQVALIIYISADYREQPAIDSALPSQKSPSVEDFSTTKARPEPAPKPVLSGRQAETSRDTRGPTVSTISQPTRTNLESAHTRTDSEVSTSSKKKGFLSKVSGNFQQLYVQLS